MTTLQWVILYGVIVLAFILLLPLLRNRKERKARQAIRHQKILSSDEFLDAWILDEKKKTGLKYDVFPGCYVIFLFDKPVRGKDYRNYDDIYIGQSVNVTRRVHGHFTGKGKGDVYADMKYGRHAYVELVPCDREDMNDVERALIEVFHSTDSYNDTAGGGQDRTKKKPFSLFRG